MFILDLNPMIEGYSARLDEHLTGITFDLFTRVSASSFKGGVVRSKIVWDVQVLSG